jgi:hypothetical protein
MDYYRVCVYHSILKFSSLALTSLIVVAIVVDLVRFLPVYSVHILIFVLVVCLKQGEIIARLTLHTTLRGQSKIALAAAASLLA